MEIIHVYDIDSNPKAVYLQLLRTLNYPIIIVCQCKSPGQNAYIVNVLHKKPPLALIRNDLVLNMFDNETAQNT